jgi:hypothetical protein
MFFRKSLHNEHTSLRASQMEPIYRILMDEARCRAVFPGDESPMLMIGGKCSCFRVKAAYISGHLPPVVPEEKAFSFPCLYSEHSFSLPSVPKICYGEYIALEG